MNKCPFGLKKHEECALYRKGYRIIEKTGEKIPFEECAINIIADSVEGQVQRTLGLQAEMNEVRKRLDILNTIFATALRGKIEDDITSSKKASLGQGKDPEDT